MQSHSAWPLRWCIRWIPALAAVAVFVGSLWSIATEPSASIRHVSLVISALIWVSVAAWVTIGPAHRVLVSRLQRRPLAALLLIATTCGSALAIVYFAPALAWLPASMALLLGSLSANRPAVSGLTWVFISGSTVFLTDSALILFRNSPTLAQASAVRRVAEPLYRADWNVIQFMPECAQYDDDLTYTLRPGQCEFTETEFQTTYDINRLGVRDDEESLHRPVVIACGDSVTMGWGVEENESFPAHVERLTKLKVLNAGIASYGTSREMALLHRVDRSAARYLIVQYSGNDYSENRAFAKLQKTPVRTQGWYRMQQRYVASQRRYRPGKYLYETYRREAELRLARWKNESEPPEESDEVEAHRSTEDEANVFLQALSVAPRDLESVHLILFLGGQSDLAREVQRQWPASGLATRFASMRITDPTFSFRPQEMFLLDPHPNAAGQEKIGHLLADLILEIERGRSPTNGS